MEKKVNHLLEIAVNKRIAAVPSSQGIDLYMRAKINGIYFESHAFRKTMNEIQNLETKQELFFNMLNQIQNTFDLTEQQYSYICDSLFQSYFRN